MKQNEPDPISSTGIRIIPSQSVESVSSLLHLKRSGSGRVTAAGELQSQVFHSRHLWWKQEAGLECFQFVEGINFPVFLREQLGAGEGQRVSL